MEIIKLAQIYFRIRGEIIKKACLETFHQNMWMW